jgi:hypothetical protein
MVRSATKRVVSAKTGGRDGELWDAWFQRRCREVETKETEEDEGKID